VLLLLVVGVAVCCAVVLLAYLGLSMGTYRTRFTANVGALAVLENVCDDVGSLVFFAPKYACGVSSRPSLVLEVCRELVPTPEKVVAEGLI